jgi:hypothetical protein
MILPPLPDPFFLLEDQIPGTPEEILVDAPAPIGAAAPAAAETAAAPPEPPTVAPEPPVVTPVEAPPAMAEPEPPPAPAFTLPSEEEFPTLAELDAIRDAHAGAPTGPDAAARAELLALLGLDPAIANDPALFDATVAGLPDPDADQVMAEWVHEAGIDQVEWPEPVGDWQLG